MMTGMTPEDAEHSYEGEEDASEVFAWFDAGPHGVTAPPAGAQEPPSAEIVSRVLASGLYGHWREELLPEVSVAAGSNTRWAQQG
jgi:hypothetical protein